MGFLDRFNRPRGSQLPQPATPPVSVTFPVSEVVVAGTPLAEVPYRSAVEALLRAPGGPPASDVTVEACAAYRLPLVAGVEFHPFLAAVHMAFNEHRPLIFSPDMIWLLLAQGFANHVSANSPTLRPQLVQHEGRQRLTIRRNDFVKGSPENPWEETFGEFTTQIREYLGAETHDLLLPTFSTTGETERAAAQVVLLDAMQSYFEYDFVTLCGIPRITLEGTPADWATLVERARGLARFGIEWWIEAVVPVLEQFERAAKGEVDARFWRSLYKQNDDSGGPHISGWITRFFPYLKHPRSGYAIVPNGRPRPGSQPSPGPFEGGLELTSFPAGLSRAPFRWTFLLRRYAMEFLGGFTGIRQLPETWALRPEIGWAVREAPAG